MDDYGVATYDLVFYGDDLVENLNGHPSEVKQVSEINKYYKETFTYDNEESSVNSVALGITGDSVSVSTETRH